MPAAPVSPGPGTTGDASLVPADGAHAAVLAAIHAAAFAAAEAWGADAMRLQLALPGCFGWLRPDAAGFVLARVAADEAELLTLAVLPAARRRGLGAALLAAAAREAARRGARALFLEVADGNAGAQALYGAAGFAPVGRRSRYYPGGADALVLRLGLDMP